MATHDSYAAEVEPRYAYRVNTGWFASQGQPFLKIGWFAVSQFRQPLAYTTAGVVFRYLEGKKHEHFRDTPQ